MCEESSRISHGTPDVVFDLWQLRKRARGVAERLVQTDKAKFDQLLIREKPLVEKAQKLQKTLRTSPVENEKIKALEKKENMSGGSLREYNQLLKSKDKRATMKLSYDEVWKDIDQIRREKDTINKKLRLHRQMTQDVSLLDTETLFVNAYDQERQKLQNYLDEFTPESCTSSPS